IIRIKGGGLIWILLSCLFVNGLITSLGHFIGPSLNADIRDYQQYITGERIDGMFAAVGLIGNIITLATSSVLPAIYERSGLNEATMLSLGIKSGNVYDVLYDPAYFTHICSVLIIASIVGAALNVIPFFFYDLTEAKQKAMVSVLKIRAAFEDYGNGAAGEESLAEAKEIIGNAEKFIGRTPVSEKGLSGKEFKEAREINDGIVISQLVLAEINKFNTPEGKAAIERAKEIAGAGLDGFGSVITADISEAKRLPKGTHSEREIRAAAIRDAREAKLAAKVRAKYFADGLKPFDMTALNELFEQRDKNEENIKATLDNIKQANEKSDKAAASALKAELSSLRTEKKNIDTLIKKETTDYTLYSRAAGPYLNALRLIDENENYIKAADAFKE
ncbi:MAG: MFS transporter, partial [Clostridia bacterium]|nr:MFS transporter [Clostridia bacterium]